MRNSWDGSKGEYVGAILPGGNEDIYEADYAAGTARLIQRGFISQVPAAGIYDRCFALRSGDVLILNAQQVLREGRWQMLPPGRRLRIIERVLVVDDSSSRRALLRRLVTLSVSGQWGQR